MSSFNGKRLFTSGPHRFHIGGVSLRHVLHETPSRVVGGGVPERRVQLSSQGVQGRAIVQEGDLIADSPRRLRALSDAIEAQLDGLPHRLVDDRDEYLDDVVMLAFAPGPMSRLGARWRRSYRIQYLQLAA